MISLMLSLGTITLAADTPAAKSQETITRSPDCDYCGTKTNTTNGKWTAWGYNGNNRVCPKIPYMYDYEQVRQRLVTYKCPKCAYSFTVTETQKQWICSHPVK